MTLPAGTRVGPYEILSALGVGGMGEVYRARDPKLNREVAIKVLLPSVVADPDRIARFRREAQVLASLNHPNIAHIHGIEEADGVTALVLELVEGEDLAQRLARGPLAIDDALSIAVQLAEALESAHDLGIIHRDLKPANIKLRPDGTVKVLDFGLAKAIDPGGSTSAEAMNSPTLSMHATQAGVVLGTAAYMSPEQARGKVVDRRADIWAFGVVLYEMLTGQRPFKGDDVTDILASVLKDTPAFDALPATTPPQLRWVIERCLQRDPKARLRDIGEARIQLAATTRGDTSGGTWQASWFANRAAANDAEALSRDGAAQTRRQVLQRRLVSVFIAIIALVAAIVAWSARNAAPLRQPPVVRFMLNAPDNRAIGTLVRSMALSPSGEELAYVNESQVLLRRLSEFNMHPLPATDLRRNLQLPVYSPDGKWLAYYSGNLRRVNRVSLEGGAALPVCDGVALSVDWDASGILIGRGARGIARCNPAGGPPEQLAQVDEGEVALGPQILPDGDSLLFTIAKTSPGTGVRWDEARVVVQSLRTSERKTILEKGSDARFVASGHLIYAIGGIVFAAPFDLGSHKVRIPGVAVIEGVRRGTSGALQLAVSTAGTLIYMPGATGEFAVRQLAIADRSGAVTRLPIPSAAYSHVRVSRDGLRVAIGVNEGKEARILIHALGGASPPQRLTTVGPSWYPIWSPDGQWIAYSSSAESVFGLFRQRADGTGMAERLTTAAAGEEHVPESWAIDNRLAYSATKASGSAGSSLWMLSLPDKKATAFAGIRSTDPVFSPDGKWVAYGESMETGGFSNADRGIFVEPVPPTGEKHQVPRELVDFHPAWSVSGAELVFTGSANTAEMAAVPVSVTKAGSLKFGTSVRFAATVTGERVAGERRAWDLMPDGRMIGIVPVGEAPTAGVADLRLVVNWFEELKQRVPVQ